MDGLSRITVIGAGTMGAGVAAELARFGCRVRLVDVDEDRLAHGMERIRLAQRMLVDADRLTEQDAGEARARIETTTQLETACEAAQLVLEAASEAMEVKQRLFGVLDAHCDPGTILATNTSGLSITRIAAATRRPEHVAGMHFWNPPHLMPLVEVTRGEKTAESTTERLMALARRIGKRPILVKHDVPGFVGNRLQFAVFREALHLLSEGVASAEDIDTAMTAGPGFRYNILGPLRTADLGGLDVFHAISEYLFSELSAATRPPQALTDRIRAGKLGAKTGEGFYSYSRKDLGDAIVRRDRVLLGLLDVLEKEGKETTQ